MMDKRRTPSESTAPSAPKVASSLRLQVVLSLFITLLLVGVSGVVFGLVSRIFDRLTPQIEADLRWKTQRGVRELAQSSDLGLAVHDVAMLRAGLTALTAGNADLAAVVIVGKDGAALVRHGSPPDDIDELFAGDPDVVRARDGSFVAWSAAMIEGILVGKVAVVVSTARLSEGHRLRTSVLSIAGISLFAALVVAMFFVRFYIRPILGVIQKSQQSMKEMEIARRIQTSILPRELAVEALEVSAKMIPATEVGGDYYDILPVPGGCWIGIGDVSGHGLPAGLIMLMVQSVVASLVRAAPNAGPVDLVRTLNATLYDNIRRRLGNDEHVTFTLFHYSTDGRLRFAGAHEDIIVYRAGRRLSECLATPGTWIGIGRNIDHALTESTIALERGDVVVLYTDGVTEAKDISGKQLGLDRLCEVVDKHAEGPSELLRDAILEAVRRWTAVQDDDVSVMVLRYLGSEAS
jgi:serine phosphatase RsbU (regulator of sigma subunit)